jgi:site-specific DNA-methyltransferase (cytosine-N4-specific)
VLDIFGGSNITGKIAESKGRHWLAFERDEKYLETSQFRFLEEEQIRKRLNEDQIDFGDFAKIGKND